MSSKSGLLSSTEHKITINHIFSHNRNWECYVLQHRASIRLVELGEVDKMLTCRDSSRGYFVYQCPEHREEIKVLRFGCNSRLCTHCGTKFTDEWSDRITELTFDVPHRHIVFTMPEMLWPLFKADRTLQKDLLDCAIRTLKKVLHFFMGRDIRPGAIVALHTYGKDLKWNPHLHSITTEGGFDTKSTWVEQGFSSTAHCASAGCTKS